MQASALLSIYSVKVFESVFPTRKQFFSNLSSGYIQEETIPSLPIFCPMLLPGESPARFPAERPHSWEEAALTMTWTCRWLQYGWQGTRTPSQIYRLQRAWAGLEHIWKADRSWRLTPAAQ